ncbi:MAG: tetratricopeptide repeat protein, partial [Spirochaetota bacterium]
LTCRFYTAPVKLSSDTTAKDNFSTDGITMKKVSAFLTLFIIASAILPLYAGSAYDEGIRYYKANNLEKAKEALSREVESNPANGTAWYFLGESYMKTGVYAEAENAFRKAVDANIQKKYLSLAYWNLIVLVEQRGNVGDLITAYRDFWQRTGDGGAKRKVDDMINKMIWSDNQSAADLFKQAGDLRDHGKIADAKQKYQEALYADSSFLAPHFDLGQMLYTEGKTSEAAQHFRIIADRIPYYSSVQILLGDIYYKNGSYPAAADALEKALTYGFFDSSVRFSAFLKLGSARFSTREYDKAAAAIESALEIRGSDKDALMMMSAINIKLERYDDALKSLTKLQAVSPENPDVLYQIGSIYYKQQNSEKCTRYFDQLFSVLSKGRDPLSQKYNKAMQILAKNHFSSASYKRCAEIISALPESSRDSELNLMHAKSRYQLHEYDAAIPLFEKLSLGYDDRFSLCKAYMKAGMKPKAKNALSSLCAYNSSYKDKALSDPVLAPVMKEIIADQKRAQLPAAAPSLPAAPVQSTPSCSNRATRIK